MKSNNVAIVGLGFGDEGKGQFLNYLASKEENHIFIKRTGGCQGKHTVMLENGFFSFAQLSPGIVKEDSMCILDKGFVFEPFALILEIDALSKHTRMGHKYYYKKIVIDKGCICVTPIHKFLNVADEEKNHYRGSVGTGVSICGLYSTDSDIVVYAGDLLNPFDLEQKLKKQKEFFVGEAKRLGLESKEIENFDIADYIDGIGSIITYGALNIQDVSKLKNSFSGLNIVYETSQGVLIDRDIGIKPNITFLNVNPSKKTIDGDFEKIGILRSIYSRHGQGIFPTEDDYLNKNFHDNNQEVGKYRGSIRFGWFDLVLLKYAIKQTEVDSMFMSCLDYLKELRCIKVCTGYRYMGYMANPIVEEKAKEIVSAVNRVCPEQKEISVKKNDFKDIFEYHTEDDGGVIITGIKCNDDMLKHYLECCVPIYDTIYFADRTYEERVEMYLSYIENAVGKKFKWYSDGVELEHIHERMGSDE